MFALADRGWESAAFLYYLIRHSIERRPSGIAMKLSIGQVILKIIDFVTYFDYHIYAIYYSIL